jgi:hypothetical protein
MYAYLREMIEPAEHVCMYVCIHAHLREVILAVKTSGNIESGFVHMACMYGMIIMLTHVHKTYLVVSSFLQRKYSPWKPACMCICMWASIYVRMLMRVFMRLCNCTSILFVCKYKCIFAVPVYSNVLVCMHSFIWACIPDKIWMNI